MHIEFDFNAASCLFYLIPAPGNSIISMAFNFAKPATGGFGGFGATAAPAPASTGFGGFGSPSPAPAPSLGGFGAAAPAAAPTTSFGGFGSAAPAPATGFGGFGGPAAAPAPASAFGGGFGAAAPAPAFGGFGAANPAAAPTTSFGGFGSPAPAPATSFGGFGAPAAAPATSLGGFGATTSGFGASATYPGQPQQQQANINDGYGYEGDLRKFLDLRRQYAPIKIPGNDSGAGFDKGEGLDYSPDSNQQIPWNDDCLFRFTVYLDKALAAKAQLSGEEALEPNAAENNPDPKTLVPRTMMGIQALKYQFQVQNKMAELMASKVSVIKDSQLESFRRKSEDLAIRIKQYQNKHNEQNGRLITLLRDVEYLRSRNRPLEKKEIEHRAEYDRLISVKNQCLSRLVTLEQTNEQYASLAAHNTQEEFLEVSDDDLDRIYHLLKEQHDGIHHLGAILNKDIRDIEIMREGMQGKHISY